MNRCRYCGVLMSNPRRVQCGSAECARRHRNAKQVRFYAQYRAATGKNYKNRYREDRTCAGCGVMINVRRDKRTARCGQCAHRAAALSRAAVEGWWTRDRKLPVLIVPVPAPVPARRPCELKRSDWWKLFVAGHCPNCGVYFVACAASVDTASRYCSSECAKRAAKLRRRAVKLGAYVADVSPRRIFERDRWTCKLCGKRVRRRAVVPDPKAPVLDHVVPLAAGRANGGVHAPWNVQCAHFLCNSIKSAMYTQGALF